LLSFAIVYFFESGLFNGLQPIQIKKSSPLLSSVSSAAPVLNHAAAGGAEFDGDWEINNTDSGFSQHNVACFRSPEYAT